MIQDLRVKNWGMTLLMPQISWKYLRPDDLFSFRRRTRLPSPDAYYQLKMFSFPGAHSSEEISVPIPDKSDFQLREPPPDLVDLTKEQATDTQIRWRYLPD